ncbi:MAG: hypothetical protein ACETWM_22145 [Candidatus Lokiarchaeia archaeon]
MLSVLPALSAIFSESYRPSSWEASPQSQLPGDTSKQPYAPYTKRMSYS